MKKAITPPTYTSSHIQSRLYSPIYTFPQTDTFTDQKAQERLKRMLLNVIIQEKNDEHSKKECLLCQVMIIIKANNDRNTKTYDNDTVDIFTTHTISHTNIITKTFTCLLPPPQHSHLRTDTHNFHHYSVSIAQQYQGDRASR